MNKTLLIVVVAVVQVAILGLFQWTIIRATTPNETQPRTNEFVIEGEAESPVTNKMQDTKSIDVARLDKVHSAFDFSATVPVDWQLEVVPNIEAVNIYDPSADGATNLEKSQIFLRHFFASDFLTLDTVEIFSSEAKTINGHEAVTYDIQKLDGVADFPDQPAWRNDRHSVTDIRVSGGASEFIVIGKRPDLSQSTFDSFVSSIEFAGDKNASTILTEPVSGFLEAITLKPFGIYITPETSPVQPDKFTGYHTGADAEVPAGTTVVAITDGIVLQSGNVQGYGGMIAIEHDIDGQRVVGVYGHLDPASLVAQDEDVVAGQRIGVLGDGFTEQTDGARAHLHLSLYRGAGLDVRGYARSEAELANWIDPEELLSA